MCLSLSNSGAYSLILPDTFLVFSRSAHRWNDCYELYVRLKAGDYGPVRSVLACSLREELLGLGRIYRVISIDTEWSGPMTARPPPLRARDGPARPATTRHHISRLRLDCCYKSAREERPCKSPW